jgi:hypothetical protein
MDISTQALRIWFLKLWPATVFIARADREEPTIGGTVKKVFIIYKKVSKRSKNLQNSQVNTNGIKTGQNVRQDFLILMSVIVCRREP